MHALPLPPTVRGPAAWTGPAMALLVYTAWSVSLYTALWHVHVAQQPLASAACVLWLQWLFCGLFITAHDACHRSAAPGRPRLNAFIGYGCAFSYAAFSYALLLQQHQAHHVHRGTASDPDFAGPRETDKRFLPWAARFFRHYLCWQQLACMALLSQVWLNIFALPVENVLLFWAMPSALSALQLFYFGTYLPHRPRATSPFADAHRSRNTPLSRPLSLLSCYFFGYHHVHHVYPWLPWYALPRGLVAQPFAHRAGSRQDGHGATRRERPARAARRA